MLTIHEDVDKAHTMKDRKHDKERLKRELEQLENEDKLRIQLLHGKLIVPSTRNALLTRNRK